MLVVNTDASISKSGVGISWIIKQYPNTEILVKGADYLRGSYSSVEGEYEAIVRAVREAVAYSDGYDRIVLSSDCEPIVNHLEGTAPMRGNGNRYKRKVITAINRFPEHDFRNIPRSLNGDTDALAHTALLSQGKH